MWCMFCSVTCALLCCTNICVSVIIPFGFIIQVGFLMIMLMNSYESVFPYSNISDEDFSLLFEQDDTDFHIDFQMLNNVSSEVLETGKNTYIDDGVDPDDNYFSNNNICKYWLSDDFNEYSDALSPSSFGMIHFNSRSMLKNFDSIHEFILHLKFKFPIIWFS